MTRFGCMVESVNDQGTHFLSKVIEEMIAQYLIIIISCNPNGITFILIPCTYIALCLLIATLYLVF